MIAPWKVRHLAVENLVGYQRLEWKSIHPELNLLIGQNGVGKSVLLETLVAALRFLQGRHARDTFLGKLPNVSIELGLYGEAAIQRFTTEEIAGLQGSHDTGWSCEILQIVENRQPKNKIGKEGSPNTNNHIMRYPASLAKLQRLLRSRADEDIAFAETVYTYCCRLAEVGTPSEWARIWSEIRDRGETLSRPVSCGQFDAISLVVDLVTFQQTLLTSPSPHFVIFDNPETYLHPAAVRPILDLFREVLSTGQFFVASHGIRGVFYPERKSVFFLSREARANPLVDLVPLSELPRGGQEAFLQLYGADVGSGFLSVVGEIASPTFHRFLCECVRDCASKLRGPATADHQLVHAASLMEIPRLTILDVGAGNGDLLDALDLAPRDGWQYTYFAYDDDPADALYDRINRAIREGLITPTSLALRRFNDPTPPSDLVVFMNLCHHLTPSELAVYLSESLRERVQRRAGAGLMVVELRTLAAGERQFVLWTPDDYRELFTPWSELSVTSHPLDGDHPEQGHDVTKICWSEGMVGSAPEAEKLEARLWAMLPSKRITLIRELEARLDGAPREGSDQYWHQKRVAFICASLAWIARAEWKHLGEPHLSS